MSELNADVLRKIIDEVLERLHWTPEAPDDYARALLVEPLVEPEDPTIPATVGELRRFLKRSRQRDRTYGLAHEVPANGYIAEVLRAPSIIILTQECIVEAVAVPRPTRLLEGEIWKASAYDIEQNFNRVIGDWMRARINRPIPPTHHLGEKAIIALDLKVVAGSLKRI